MNTPKTDKQHKEQGTYRPTRHKNRASAKFKPLGSIPSPPKYFTAEQAVKWNTICAMLYRDGMLSDTYLELIERYCNCWLTWWKAAQEVEITGLTITSDTGNVRQNPAVNIEKEMLALMVRILAEFGHTPRAAMSVKIIGEIETPDDPLSDIKKN